MSQQYSLRWNNHQPNFISMFTSLLNTRTLVDVTLAAEGKHVQAHKVVLSACSTYFQTLFVDNPSSHPIVILKDVSFADLRTMVDFMYYGEVNVTEEQLPQVLDTAKLLKIKGLTEMPDSTSLTRAQGSLGTSSDLPGDNAESQRQSASPSMSPSNRKKRRRKSSTGSTSLNVINEETGQAIDLVREPITLSNIENSKQYEDRMDSAQQTGEPPNITEPLPLEPNVQQLSQAPPSSSFGRQKNQRLKFKRQSRVEPEDREIRKQTSEPLPVATMVPTLQKHDSYPQYSSAKNKRLRPQVQEVGSLLIRAVTVTTPTSTAYDNVLSDSSHTQRASHTPAVRLGPPLSCNFCWNTVDECGRILRRKTQYHCPECRTNLCIVPCFHEYHDSTETEATASAR